MFDHVTISCRRTDVGRVQTHHDTAGIPVELIRSLLERASEKVGIAYGVKLLNNVMSR